MKRKIYGFIFLVGIFMTLISFNTITGAVIGKSANDINTFYLLCGLLISFISMTLFVHSKTLEAITVPTGADDDRRVKRAMKEYGRYQDNETPYLLVTGVAERDENGRIRRNSQQYNIYKNLRKEYGLKPSDMIIESKSRDTLENFLYSIKKLDKKGIDKIDISTNKTQYWRFKMFENEAKREGLIGKDFEMRPLYTNETPKEFIYGVLALAKDYFRIKSSKSLKEAKNNHTGSSGKFVKEIINKS